jgi:hypothetical protein
MNGFDGAVSGVNNHGSAFGVSLVNPALHAAITSAAKQHKQLLDQLKDQGAFSRESAMKSEIFVNEQNALIKHYRKRGIIRSTPDGGLYLDRRAYEDHLSSQKTAGKWALMILGVSVLVGILLLLANKL